MAGSTDGPVHRGEEGFWLNGRWHKYLQLLDDDQRELPFTVPDEDMRMHSDNCACKYCPAPHVKKMKEERAKRVYSRFFENR